MMIEEEAIVVSSNGQYAWVSPLENSSCSGCESSGACSTSFLKGILKRKSERTIRIVNLEAVEPGEHVIVGIHSVNLLISSALVYLLPILCLPILCLIIFALLGKVFFSETASILLGLSGLAFGFFAVNRTTANLAVCGRLEPVMLGKRKAEEKVIEFSQASALLRL